MNDFKEITLSKDELKFLKKLNNNKELVIPNNKVCLHKILREEELIKISFTQSNHVFKITERGRSYLEYLKRKNKIYILKIVASVGAAIGAIIGVVELYLQIFK